MKAIFDFKPNQHFQPVYVQVIQLHCGEVRYITHDSRAHRETFERRNTRWGRPLYRVNVYPRTAAAK